VPWPTTGGREARGGVRPPVSHRGTIGKMRGRDLINLTVRVTMECGVVAAFADWGVHAGGSTGMKIVLGILAPAVAFGFWGAVDFHQFGRLAEPLRLLEELAISGLAAVALYTAGHHALAVALGALSLLYHALVYATGARLLKSQERHAPRGVTSL
jgi:Protein of unknown function (DUF2568)